MNMTDASTQTFKYQKFPKTSEYTKNKLYCENCEYFWLHHEKDHLLLYYFDGRKYCIDCRHGLDQFTSLQDLPFRERIIKWIKVFYTPRTFKCCSCSDVTVHHKLGDNYFGKIPAFMNAAVPNHTLCEPCYENMTVTRVSSPESCNLLVCRNACRFAYEFS